MGDDGWAAVDATVGGAASPSGAPPKVSSFMEEACSWSVSFQNSFRLEGSHFQGARLHVRAMRFTLVTLVILLTALDAAPLNRLGGWPTTDEPLDCAMRGLGLEYAKGESGDGRVPCPEGE